jgi:hypothetical protein
MSTISAGTTTGTALVSTGDTTGALVLQTNGGTTAVTIGTNQVVTLAQPLPVASGGTGGSSTPTAGGVVYGTGTAQAVSAAGTAGQYLQSNGASAPTWAAVSAGFTLGTPVATTSGTAIDFTGIPAGTKQIVVIFKNVSTNGSSQKVISIGDSGGIETSGYTCVSKKIDSTTITSGNSTRGYVIQSTLSSDELFGSVFLVLENSTTNSWTAGGNLGASNDISVSVQGIKSLSAVLDRVRITTQGETDTFDAGEINIAYI